MQKVYFRDLGVVEYGQAWQLQEEILKAGLDVKSRRITGGESAGAEDIVNHFLFCSHPHVYTLGKSGHMENLLINDNRLQELGATFFKTNRGGDITYHGPGQIVGYPILDLEQFFTDLGRYMRSLEEVIIKTLSRYGIEAGRLAGSTGVWLDPDNPARARKICAMGVRCSRWITMHGFALNVNTDMRFFDYIVPCGIGDKAVTSMQKELGRPVDEQEVKNIIREEFGKVFDAEIIQEPALSYV
ncbi:MAG: lipoyl(octanoyl) transferase LipB [Taibaiella sp.]|nr:lipoyl(octanoyl) transferase LipB [Taibaiella sp.]